MFRYRSSLLVACLLGMCAAASAADGAAKAFLLNVGKGQIPSDTGMDDKTVLTLVDSPDLGGKAVKVPLAAEDSFGVKTSAVPNWKKFTRLRMEAFNPSAQTIELELVVIHRKSSGHPTRVGETVKLKPGKNEISVDIKGLKNNDGSEPDLSSVTRWYFADASKLEETFFVGDIWLEGGDAATPSGSTAPTFAGGSKSPSPIGYRVKGKIGTSEVDLTVTPLFAAPADSGATATPAAATKQSAKPQGDSARLVRIRAAKAPAISKPISFENPQADAIVSALEILPPDNPLYQDVSEWPLHPNSENIIASIGAEKPLRGNRDMGYVLVPPNQKKVPVKLGEIAEESDKGPYPVPDNLPIELWPIEFTGENAMTLDELQRNVKNDDGDRHAIVVDPVSRTLYEFYQMKKTSSGWEATQATIFDLKSNKLRPDGWTSADAAGLPIFPYTVRYDELKRGVVEHALRVTVSKSRKAYVYPATHFASRHTDENLPRMGERIRLKKDYDVSQHTPEVQAILKALQKYGMLVADNGIDWALSIVPDPRIPSLHEDLRKVPGSAFEVVEAPEGYGPPQ